MLNLAYEHLQVKIFFWLASARHKEERRGGEGGKGILSPLEFKSGYALVVTNRLNLLDESKLTKALAFNC